MLNRQLIENIPLDDFMKVRLRAPLEHEIAELRHRCPKVSRTRCSTTIRRFAVGYYRYLLVPGRCPDGSVPIERVSEKLPTTLTSTAYQSLESRLDLDLLSATVISP